MLLLDEPTNYLDAETSERFEGAIAAYPGTMIFATHDRRLVKNAADHTIGFRDGNARFSERTPFA